MKKTTISPAEPNNGKPDIALIQSQSEPCADTRVLAVQLGNQHENTYDLVKRYEADFLELGILRFETGEIVGRGQPEKYALLNEDQCYLLLTYSRNTPKVRALKINLIKAFREARYGMACQSLLARKEEASQSGKRLAHWRYDKPGAYQYVAHLREQLKLPLDQDGGDQ
ncbi:Phage regulatory protein Rha [compost metagenome]